jgi:hypothetical protein
MMELPVEILFEIFNFIDDVLSLIRLLLISQSIHQVIKEILPKRWSLFSVPSNDQMREIKFYTVNKSGFWNLESENCKNLEISVMCDKHISLKQLLPFFTQLTWINFSKKQLNTMLNYLCFSTEPYPFNHYDCVKNISILDIETKISDIHEKKLFVCHKDRLDIKIFFEQKNYVILNESIIIGNFGSEERYYCLAKN